MDGFQGRPGAGIERVGWVQVKAVAGLLLEIEGERQEDGASGRGQRGLEGATGGDGEVLDTVELGGPLGPGAGDGDEVGRQDGFGESEAAVLLSGGDEQGGTLAVGVVEHAHGVAEAAGGVEVDDAHGAGGLGQAIGHGQDRDFLEAQDVAEAVVVSEGLVQGQLGGAGVAEDVADTGLGQHLKKSLDAIHEGRLVEAQGSVASFR